MSPDIKEMLIDAELMLNRIDAEVARAMEAAHQAAFGLEDTDMDEHSAALRLCERLRGVLSEIRGVRK